MAAPIRDMKSLGISYLGHFWLATRDCNVVTPLPRIRIISFRSSRRIWRRRSLTLETRFSELHQLLATPANYLVLRILTLTLFRSVALGAWIRDRIVRRLIAAARPGPLILRRRVAFEPDAITR
jgi:hypothetical protein